VVSQNQKYFDQEGNRKAKLAAFELAPILRKHSRYGFVENPILALTVTPQVGVKEVLYTTVTEWIADKLKMELHVGQYAKKRCLSS
jgi:hypothetical protein